MKQIILDTQKSFSSSTQETNRLLCFALKNMKCSRLQKDIF